MNPLHGVERGAWLTPLPGSPLWKNPLHGVESRMRIEFHERAFMGIRYMELKGKANCKVLSWATRLQHLNPLHGVESRFKDGLRITYEYDTMNPLHEVERALFNTSSSNQPGLG